MGRPPGIKYGGTIPARFEIATMATLDSWAKKNAVSRSEAIPPGRARAEGEEVNSETLDSKPTPEFLMALGTINFLWASIEAYASAALFSLLEIDQHDFTILVGRSEVIPKFEKIRQILAHRSDGRLQQAIDLICKLQKLRPDRNAITHGYYQGKSARGEHIFFLMADAMIDEKEGGVRKMRVFTDQELGDHCSKTMDLFTEIQSVFDSAKMRELFSGSFMVPTHLRG